MACKILILDSAKDDFMDMKQQVKREFGENIWNTVNTEYKAAMDLIKNNPGIGSQFDELKELGIDNIRYVLVRQTRMMYEFDATTIVIHGFIHTRRDYRTHLLKRLLRVL